MKNGINMNLLLQQANILASFQQTLTISFHFGTFQSIKVSRKAPRRTFFSLSLYFSNA